MTCWEGSYCCCWNVFLCASWKRTSMDSLGSKYKRKNNTKSFYKTFRKIFQLAKWKKDWVHFIISRYWMHSTFHLILYKVLEWINDISLLKQNSNLIFANIRIAFQMTYIVTMLQPQWTPSILKFLQACLPWKCPCRVQYQ